MPLYAYRCRECGATRDSLRRDDVRVCPCGGVSRRDFSSVHLAPQSFRPHFNIALGQYVRTDQEFRDGLKRASEHESQVTGCEHSYEPLYPSDTGKDGNRIGVTDINLDAEYRKRRDDPSLVSPLIYPEKA